jgi:hypothetical protein
MVTNRYQLMMINKITQTLVGADLSALAGFSGISLHVLITISYRHMCHSERRRRMTSER